MKTSTEGFQQCRNAQMAVNGERQIIVAPQVGPEATDQGQMILFAMKQTFKVQPEVVLADAGYGNEEALVELEERGIDGHVALGRGGQGAGGGGSKQASRQPPYGRRAGDPNRAGSIVGLGVPGVEHRADASAGGL